VERAHPHVDPGRTAALARTCTARARRPRRHGLHLPARHEKHCTTDARRSSPRDSPAGARRSTSCRNASETNRLRGCRPHSATRPPDFPRRARDVLDDYRINRKRSLGDVQRHLRLHLEPFFGRRRMAAITTADIRRYVVRRQDEGAKNATINRELSALSAPSRSRSRGTLRRAAHPPLRETTAARVLRAEEFEAVRGRLRPDLADFVAFLYARVALAIRSRRLRWANVAFDAVRSGSSRAPRRRARAGSSRSPPSSARCSNGGGRSTRERNASSDAPSARLHARAREPSAPSTRPGRRLAAPRAWRAASPRLPAHRRAQPRPRRRPRAGRDAAGRLEVSPDARSLPHRQHGRPDRGARKLDAARSR